MNFKQKILLNVVISVVIASALILLTSVFPDEGAARATKLALIAVWIVQLSYLTMICINPGARCRNHGKSLEVEN